MAGKASLLTVIGYLALFWIVAGSINQSGTSAVRNSVSYYDHIMAKNIAGSAINICLQKLSRDKDWRTGYMNVPFAGGAFQCSVSDEPAIGANAVRISAQAVYNGCVDSGNVCVDVFGASNRFSRYSYFSNTEPAIYFNTNDTIYGPVHTNGQFHIMGTPVFFGLVSSVSPTYEKLGEPDPQFLGGTDFGRNSIELPIDISILRNAGLSGGHYVSVDNMWITFQNDGSYLYKVGYGGVWQTAQLSSINGVIICEENVYVKGTIKGQVTLSSSKNIYIIDDILYSDNPIVNPESTDMLGLVAVKNVIVQDNTANRVNCEIYGSIMTIEESFKAENIYFQPAGKLIIYGGIIQQERGPVGTAYPSGYKKLYRYDERFEYAYPPYFPIADGALSSLYEQMAEVKILSWYE